MPSQDKKGIDKSFGTAASAVSKATQGNLFSVHATNKNAAIRYLHLFNRSSVPTLGTAPLFSFEIGAGSSITPATAIVGSDFFGEDGLYFSTGITWGISTTNATYTAATAADHNVHLIIY